MTDALDAVIDAALERALLEETDARRYFALAGALERARAATDDGREASAPAAPEPRKSENVDSLTAAMMSLAAVSALEEPESDGIDPTVWSPGRPPSRWELVAVGAATAYRRFDVDVDSLVARSGTPRSRLRRGGDAPSDTRR